MPATISSRPLERTAAGTHICHRSETHRNLEFLGIVDDEVKGFLKSFSHDTETCLYVLDRIIVAEVALHPGLSHAKST